MLEVRAFLAFRIVTAIKVFVTGCKHPSAATTFELAVFYSVPRAAFILPEPGHIVISFGQSCMSTVVLKGRFVQPKDDNRQLLKDDEDLVLRDRLGPYITQVA